MKKSTLFPFLLFLIKLGSASGQSPATETYTFNASAISATIHSGEMLFSEGSSGAFIPKQAGLPEISLLQGSGFWLAGTDVAGNIRGAVMRNGSSDFKPGVLPDVNGGQPGTLTGIWPVSCGDIAAHLQDFQDNGIIDAPLPRIFGFPGMGNGFFNQYNAPQYDLGFGFHSLGGFFDATQDAIYDPQMGEVPTIEVRGCPTNINARELTWFAYNDQLAVPHPSGFMPAGVEVQAQAFTFQSADNSPINQTVFVRYKFINRSDVALDSCYAGIYTDLAIGNPDDDFIGTIPDKQLVFAYNGDDTDENGFGTDIPVVGIDFLRGPFSTSIEVLPFTSAQSIGDPDGLTSMEMYNLLKGKQADGSAAANNGIAFPGDPSNPDALSEIAAGNTPGKRRSLISAGPLAFQPGAVNEIIVAYYYAFQPGASVQQQVSALIQQSDELRGLFDNCFMGTETSCDALLEAPEYTIHVKINMYPNPAAESVTIESTGEGFSKVKVSDVLGRTVNNIQLSAAQTKYVLPTDQLASGMYLVRVGGQTLPLVIQH